MSGSDDAGRASAAIAAWRAAARRLLDAVGWSAETLAVRPFAGGASLALTAPIDALYAATDLNEAAWEMAAAELAGRAAEPVAAVVARLRAAIAGERNPALVALREAARARDSPSSRAKSWCRSASGGGALVWPAGALPDPAAVDWSRVHDVPIALVTGSNGKTTVVRLLAAMLAGHGLTVGHTSTDGVSVARRPARRGRLQRAERRPAAASPARGGGGGAGDRARRAAAPGARVERAAVAVVTNVADDHLGEFGIESLDQLADVKLLAARAVRPEGAVVLNADDPLLRERRRSVERSGGLVPARAVGARAGAASGRGWPRGGVRR